ncbi:acyl-coenzyme A diphosphatase NUDT19-like [Glandiceps talaboti]
MAKAPGSKPWKDAATVIIAARSPNQHLHGRAKEINYNLLMLKRHSKSSFFPDRYVYPGGALDNADLSTEWLQLFKQAGTPDALKALQDIDGKRPPIFATERATGTPNEVAFRICAIREAFEEAGLLLVKPNQSTVYEDVAKWSDIRRCVKQIGRDKLREWRKRVHDDASQFINLCRLLQCVPNVWALSEWSNWLTPVHERKRYDTAFYLCCLDQIPGPEMTPDNTEVVKSEWLNPYRAIELNKSGKIALAPPQSYETLRILNFNQITDLCRFNRERGKMGMLRYLPQIVAAKDGIISSLPGDSLHDEDQDPYGGGSMPTIDYTIDECLQRCQHHHRNLVRRSESGSIISTDFACNIQQPYGHVSPVDWNVLSMTKAKL